MSFYTESEGGKSRGWLCCCGGGGNSGDGLVDDEAEAAAARRRMRQARPRRPSGASGRRGGTSSVVGGSTAGTRLSSISSFHTESISDKPRRRASVYSNVNAGRGDKYFDPLKFTIVYGKEDTYKLDFGTRLGAGAYGDVWLATCRKAVSTLDGSVLDVGTKVVAKELNPAKLNEEKVKQEVKILMAIRGGVNTIEFLDVFKMKDESQFIVTEYVPDAISHRKMLQFFGDADVRHYMFELLRAIRWTHSKGIIHRDIKPDNVLYNRQMRTLRLIDWGFAIRYQPGRPIPKWPGTRFYKAPELFLHYNYYDYASDMWSVGCMLGGFLLRRPFLFDAADIHEKSPSLEQVMAIVQATGIDEWRRYLNKYNTPPYDFPYRDRYRNLRVKRRGRVDWSKLETRRNAKLLTRDGVDLLDQLLVLDHEVRMTAREALDHPYFASLRDGDLSFSSNSSAPGAPTATYSTATGATSGSSGSSLHPSSRTSSGLGGSFLSSIESSGSRDGEGYDHSARAAATDDGTARPYDYSDPGA